jgi:diguanylate cyclase (GGDEF)-like protein/PAS domain S-box-containing protein
MVNENFYKNMLDNITEGVYFVDKQKKITYWNKGAEQLTGRNGTELIGLKCADNILVHTDDKGTRLCTEGCPLTATIEDGQFRQANVYMLHKDGSRLPVHLKVNPIYNDHGEIAGAVQVFSDNSLNIRMQAKVRGLEKLVLLDELTGTGNRRYADIMLEEKINELKRYSWLFGIIFSDIDNFKSVNDTFGHDVGDKVLKMVLKTMSANVRTMDTVFRWGGEEFLTIVANTNREQLCEMADRIRILVETSALTVDKDILKVTISSGVTMATRKDNCERIIKRADSLLYLSKASGKNCNKID